MMDKILPFLETYKGRDKVLRLLCYSSKFTASLLKSPQLASQFDNFGSQLSTSRACFRLLDDIPTLAGVLSGNRKEDETLLAKVINILESIVDVIFCPVDHLSWAIGHKIVLLDSTLWDNTSTICWIISLYINIYKIFVRLIQISKRKSQLRENDNEKQTLCKLSAEQWKLEMTALKLITDFVFAVNYLPVGYLWSRFFNKWQMSALGTFSSIVGLYQSLIL